MTARLSKLHATGNDFLVMRGTNGFGGNGVIPARLCDRHRGVGADGLIAIGPPLGKRHEGADCTMRLYNADGGIAEMSGNGIRCLAWAAVRDGLGDGKQLVVDTDAGRRTVDYRCDAAGSVVHATVDMGPVTFDPARIPLDAASPFDLEATYHGVTYRGDAVGMGNPHLVLFVDDPAQTRVTTHGPNLEVDDRFPNRTNVEFVTVSGPDELTMRVWERGVGETLSCGTGACAAAAVARRRGLVGDAVTVQVSGGELSVSLGDTIRLGGPVVHVFDLELDVDAFLRGYSR
jgi:diaminopimelate epimerase